MPSHEAGGAFDECLLSLPDGVPDIAAAQDHGSDDISLTEDRTDDLRHRFIRIVPGDFNGIFGLDIRDDIFSFTHDLLELSGDRGADALFFYAACDSDDLIPVRDADALTGSGGQCFRVFFCKASKLPDREYFLIIIPFPGL